MLWAVDKFSSTEADGVRVWACRAAELRHFGGDVEVSRNVRTSKGAEVTERHLGIGSLDQ